MFHEMRRKKQELTAAEAAAVLARGTCGVLALSGDDGYPYAVPVSYVLDGEKLFFHSAPTGHKVDAIRAVLRGKYLDVLITDEATEMSSKSAAAPVMPNTRPKAVLREETSRTNGSGATVAAKKAASFSRRY